MSFAYHPFYCEENVWHLCGRIELENLLKWVVFVTNAKQTCAVWQMKSTPPGEPVIWDYHCFLITFGEGPLVWDLDSRLGCPADAGVYLAGSFPSLPMSAYRPRFRVVEGLRFRDLFSSDRSHMRGPNGAWLHQPPPWPPIGIHKPVNLARFLDLGDPFEGRVLDLPELHSALELA